MDEYDIPTKALQIGRVVDEAEVVRNECGLKIT